MERPLSPDYPIPIPFQERGEVPLRDRESRHSVPRRVRAIVRDIANSDTEHDEFQDVRNELSSEERRIREIERNLKKCKESLARRKKEIRRLEERNEQRRQNERMHNHHGHRSSLRRRQAGSRSPAHPSRPHCHNDERSENCHDALERRRENRRRHRSPKGRYCPLFDRALKWSKRCR